MQYFTADTLAKTLEQAGFVLVHVEAVGVPELSNMGPAGPPQGSSLKRLLLRVVPPRASISPFSRPLAPCARCPKPVCSTSF